MEDLEQGGILECGVQRRKVRDAQRVHDIRTAVAIVERELDQCETVRRLFGAAGARLHELGIYRYQMGARELLSERREVRRPLDQQAALPARGRRWRGDAAGVPVGIRCSLGVRLGRGLWPRVGGTRLFGGGGCMRGARPRALGSAG
jgi:hypothetical protein